MAVLIKFPVKNSLIFKYFYSNISLFSLVLFAYCFVFNLNIFSKFKTIVF